MSHDVTQSEAAIWREKYGRERKRSRILTAATVVCALAAVGLGAWGFSQSSEPGPQAGFSGQMMPGGAPPSDGQMPDLTGQLFNDDGSVDKEALQQFLSRQPSSGGIDQFLEFAQQNGQLTSQQAEKLKAAAEELQQS